MRMEIEHVGLAPADTRKIRACFEVSLAAERVDEPEGPWFTERPFAGWMTVGWDGNPREAWLATDQGSAVGWYRLELPARENADQAHLNIVVHPAARRRGLGRALLQHAAGRAAAHGRTALNGGARDGSPGEAFARSAGAKPGLVDVQRVLDIGKLEKGKLARLRGPAERAAAGYSLVSWAGTGARGVHRAGGGGVQRDGRRPQGPRDHPRGMGRPAGPRARQRPAPAIRDARLHGRGAARRHRRAGRADRDFGGSGRPRLGLPGVHGGDAGSTAGTGSACC